MHQALNATGSTTTLAGPPSVVIVPATVASLGVVRAALREALDEHEWESDPTFRVLLAATEAVANAVEHGSSCAADLIEVTYQVSDTQCFVRVLDCGTGKPWNPTTTPNPPAVDHERGRGLVIIATHARLAEARRSGTGTEVRMNFTRDA